MSYGVVFLSRFSASICDLGDVRNGLVRQRRYVVRALNWSKTRVRLSDPRIQELDYQADAGADSRKLRITATGITNVESARSTTAQKEERPIDETLQKRTSH